MALKCTGVELELLTDPDQYLMVEGAIRGGISTISTRYGKANNPLIEGFDPSQPTKYITDLITYSIVDLNNDEIKGNFYEQELQKTTQEMFRTKKVIMTLEQTISS